ncbi:MULTISPECIES: hypothetical protein [Burkholderia]|uniref:hypothetical protein n=1 Tax=Burkholderia TaxID=32008 RepID=UPI000F574D1E|nr:MULTISPECIES: hypothetical protein [Burkholderia]
MKTSIVLRRSSQTIEIDTLSYRGRVEVVLQRHYVDEEGVSHPSGTSIRVPLSSLSRLIKALSAVNETLLGQEGSQ